MPTVKTKMSTSAYVLIGLLVVVAIALPILHITGVVDLSFLADGFAGVMEWTATDPINGALYSVGLIVFGAFGFYILKKYIIGTQVPTTTTTYNPMGQTITPQSSSNEETVVTE